MYYSCTTFLHCAFILRNAFKNSPKAKSEIFEQVLIYGETIICYHTRVPTRTKLRNSKFNNLSILKTIRDIETKSLTKFYIFEYVVNGL